jgi:uncharacterized surface protein with fasciclin (FAS1) repeats
MKIMLTSFCAVLSTPATDRSAARQPADLIATATESGSLKTFVRAVRAAGLGGVLRGAGPFTVFAPSDSAFEKVSAATLELLLDPVNRPALESILKHHVVAGRLDAASALRAGRVTTLAGTVLSIGLEGGRLEVDAAKVTSNDLDSSNGVIHVIDTVLRPPASPATSLIAGTPAGLIETAIERGVPLFNRGDEAACAAIYEIAAMSLLRSDAVSRAARGQIGTALRRARTQQPHAAAWTLRRVLDSAYIELGRSMSNERETPEPSPTESEAAARSLFEFESEDEIAAWRSLDDTVMGGRSSSRMQNAGGGKAAFRGTTSLENNGGFASVRAAIEPGSLANTSGITLRVRGDGRTYRLLVSESRTPGRGSYDMDFETLAGVWVVVRIPFDDMRLNIRGRRPAARPPSAENIETIGLLIGDKRAGDFDLEVDWIRSYR